MDNSKMKETSAIAEHASRYIRDCTYLYENYHKLHILR
jgi:hypothetical protein